MNSIEKTDNIGTEIAELDLLTGENEGPCLSIILKMFKESDRMQNSEILRQGLRKAKTLLNRNPAPARVIKSMVEKLDDIFRNFDPNHTEQGIGLFLSPRKKVIVHFPFAVNDMILVANSFESRDITYLKQYLKPYYVLGLSKQCVHLFRAMTHKLHEINDGKFPYRYEEEYEYAMATRANSFGNTLKGFEKDKSVLADIRVRSMLREADHHLSDYLQDPHHELVLAGMPKLISDFEIQVHARRNIIGKVTGNYQSEFGQDLGQAAWMVCQDFRNKEIQSLIKKADDLPLANKAIGIREVWDAANKGKGNVLLVEKDFRCKAYVPEGSGQIRLRLPRGKFKLVADAVDDVIEMVLQKKGKVVFVPENQLGKFEGIVMMLRYP